MRPSLFISALLLFFPLQLAAHDYELGSIGVDHPWARATAGKAPNGAAFLMLTNAGDQADYLIRVETDAAKRAELHQHSMEDGVMKMRPVEKIEIAPGGETMLKPGGLHIMLMGLTAPLKEGERFPLTLVFEEAGSLDVEVTVDAVGAMGPGHGHE